MFYHKPVAMSNNAPVLGASSSDDSVKEEIMFYPAKTLNHIPILGASTDESSEADGESSDSQKSNRTTSEDSRESEYEESEEEVVYHPKMRNDTSDEGEESLQVNQDKKETIKVAKNTNKVKNKGFNYNMMNDLSKNQDFAAISGKREEEYYLELPTEEMRPKNNSAIRKVEDDNATCFAVICTCTQEGCSCERDVERRIKIEKRRHSNIDYPKEVIEIEDSEDEDAPIQIIEIIDLDSDEASGSGTAPLAMCYSFYEGLIVKIFEL
jgi:hypothetical protein